MTATSCDHLRVRITRVIRPYSEERKSRFVGGHCEDCGSDVSREMTKTEIEDSRKGDSKWETRPIHVGLHDSNLPCAPLSE